MTEHEPERSDPPLTRRELLVLAVISLATMFTMAVAAEVGTRVWWPESGPNGCVVFDDTTQFRPRANCAARVKNAEGPWTSMEYNECGYRSLHPCGAKPAGARRVVVMGTSAAAGLYVPYEQHFVARTEHALSKRCGVPVEFQNMGSLRVGIGGQEDLMGELLKLEPDAVVLVVNPADMVIERIQRDTVGGGTPPPHTATIATAAPRTALTRLRLAVRQSRALLVAQHFMLVNEAFLFRAYQLGHEDDALRVPRSPKFAEQYAALEREIHHMADSLNARHVPFFLMPLPNRIQVAMLSNHVSLPGADPLAFLRETREIAARAGARFVEVFPAFAATPHAEHLYYPVDGHVTGDGSALIATSLEASLRNGTVPYFASCDRPL